MQSLGKHGALVRLPVAISVFQNHHLIRRSSPHLNMRISRAANHPKPPLSIPIHLHRLLNHRLSRKQLDLKTLWHNKRRLLRFHLRTRNIRQPTRLCCVHWRNHPYHHQSQPTEILHKHFNRSNDISFNSHKRDAVANAARFSS